MTAATLIGKNLSVKRINPIGQWDGGLSALPPMNAIQSLIKRLVDARDDLSYKALSIHCGMNETYLQQFVSKGTPKRLPELVREDLGGFFGLHPDTFKDPKLAANADVDTKLSTIVSVEGEEFAAISVYEGPAAAGAGATGSDAIKHRHLYRLDWLRSVTSAPVGELAVIPVSGDSMEPTLRPGDHMLIDLSQRKPTQKDGLYILRRDGDIQVKRVTAHPADNSLTIRSDNPTYDSYSGIRDEDLEVVGRVIWLGRQIA